MKTRLSNIALHLVLAQTSELNLKTYSHKPFMEVFLINHVQVVSYCVKRSLHKRSLIKLFTQAHCSHSQSHTIMDFSNLWQRKHCYRFSPTSFHTVWNNVSIVITSHCLSASPAKDVWGNKCWGSIAPECPPGYRPAVWTPMKVAHGISLKNKMSLKKFQVILKP